MEDKPLTSKEQSAVLLFAVLIAPSVVMLAGAIPALFLLFGMYMMKKEKDFSHIETAVRNYKIYVYLFLLVCVAAAVSASETYQLTPPLVWATGAVAHLAFVQWLFFRPLKAHREWVKANGVLATKPRDTTPVRTDVDIVRSERDQTYSVADELLKWAKLKEDGHISQEEFSNARRKLLQGA